MQFDEQLKDGVGSPELVAETAKLPQSSELVTETPDQSAIAQSQLAAGTLIGGTYKIVSSLGSGGMSHVYKCEDIALNRLVAVKLMHPHSTTNAQSLLRFQREGKAIALLKHPSIVEVLALQTTPEGEPYLVMEIVQGVPLSSLIEAEGALPLSRANKIVSQICDALEHAHSHGVVHRDLKPSNIMIVNPGSADESVKLLDFGIAKILAPSASIRATQTGEVFGSPGYMSPEQVLGNPISEKSDQYSLGCVIFEMLTGKMPFTSDSAFAVMMSHVQDEAPSLAKTAIGEFPAHVERTVAKMMAKDPAQRFATISDAATGFAGQAKVEKVNKSRFNMGAISVALGLLVVVLMMVLFLFASKPFGQELLWPTPRVSNYLSSWGKATDFLPTPPEKNNFALYVAHHPSYHQIVVAQYYPNVTDQELAQSFELGQPNLLRLSLQDCDNLTDHGIKALRSLSSLQELNLGSMNDITKGCLDHLSHLHSLKKLRLFDDHLTDDSMTELSKLRSLADIDLEGNLDLSRSGIFRLLDMPNLRNVDVGDTKLTKEDCLEFKRKYIEQHGLNGQDFHMTFSVHPENTIREDDHYVIRAVNDDSNRI